MQAAMLQPHGPRMPNVGSLVDTDDCEAPRAISLHKSAFGHTASARIHRLKFGINHGSEPDGYC